jgi:putative DNA primase/helicase
MDENEPKTREVVETSEYSIANRFVGQNKHWIRFTPATGRWHIWSETIWEEDNRRIISNEIARFLRTFALERAKSIEAALDDADMNTVDVRRRALKKVEKFQTNNFRHAIMQRVACDSRITISPDVWDGPSSQMLLNTPDGTVDLTTGRMRRSIPEDYITRRTRVAPRPMATPIFDAFITRIMGGNVELIEYIQRVLGYCLTGNTREQSFFFAYGTGANGKSVLMSLIEDIMADYHQRARIETFISSYKDLHPTYVATLQGARFVTATETEEGRKWNQARIQEMTGGDKIRAHFMRQDSFAFTPQFKIFIAGNHKPEMQSVGEAIHRRLHLIPFSVTIPQSERDPNLIKKLHAEWPGILHWMIQGCVSWYATGLRPPAIVQAATQDYVTSEDLLGDWFTQRCRLDPAAWEASADMFTDWRSWCQRRSIPSGSITVFSGRLIERAVVLGIERHRRTHGAGFRGVRLIGEPEDNRPTRMEPRRRSGNGHTQDDSHTVRGFSTREV